MTETVSMSLTPPSEPLPLTYEQPLVPGELRLHAAPDAVTLRWTETATRSRKNLVKASLWTLGYLCYFAYDIAEWRSSGFGWIKLIPLALIGLVSLGMVLSLTSYAATAGEARSIIADRENILFLYPTENAGVPLSRVSHFDTVRRGDLFALQLTLRQRPEDVIRWYQIRWERPNFGPFDLVTHPDRQLIERAADTLNALLAASNACASSEPPLPTSPTLACSSRSVAWLIRDSAA